jgi:hypothetical protein
VKPPVTAARDRQYCTCPVHLGRCNTNSVIYICVDKSKVVKASTILSVTKKIYVCCMHLFGKQYCTCPVYLGWHDTNRNNHICVMLPKLAKASTVGCVTKQIYVCGMYLFGNTDYLTCHSHLELHKTSRIIYICVKSPMADRASTALSFAKETHMTDMYLFGNIKYFICPCLLRRHSTNR